MAFSRRPILVSQTVSPIIFCRNPTHHVLCLVVLLGPSTVWEVPLPSSHNTLPPGFPYFFPAQGCVQGLARSPRVAISWYLYVDCPLGFRESRRFNAQLEILKTLPNNCNSYPHGLWSIFCNNWNKKSWVVTAGLVFGFLHSGSKDDEDDKEIWEERWLQWACAECSKTHDCSKWWGSTQTPSHQLALYVTHQGVNKTTADLEILTGEQSLL